MFKANYRIRTALTKKAVIDLLQQITDDKANLVKSMKGIFSQRVVGKINENSFDVQTYHSQNSVIKGSFKEEKEGTIINLQVIDNSPDNIALGLLYGIGYPIAAVFFIIVLSLNPTSIFRWTAAIIVFLGLFLLSKFLKLLHPKTDLSTDAEFIRNLVKGEIIEGNT